MRDGKILNNTSLSNINSIKQFTDKSYGFSEFANFKLQKRIECDTNRFLRTNNSPLINIWSQQRFATFLEFVEKKTPTKLALKDLNNLNVIILNFISSYKGYRHLRGLPVNGQRTWSNAWSSYRSNHILRNFKLEVAKKYYGNISYADMKIAFLAEQTNILWKQQWYSIWKKISKTRLAKTTQQQNKKTNKPDLMLMAKGQVFLPSIKKELTKKQKTKLDQSLFACGYRIGFTKLLLKA